MTEARTEKKVFVCDFPGCDKVYPKQWRLREHQCSAHTGERPFVCRHEGCTKSYVRSSHLKRHVQMSHSEEKPFKCSKEGCDAAFSVAYNLKRHEKRHELPNPYHCEEDGCEDTFRKRSQLLSHIESCHPGKKLYTCSFDSCGVQFSSKQKLERHKRRHVDGYDCPRVDCEVNVPTWSALQEHLKSHPKSFKCVHCDAVYSSKDELKQHKTTHTNIVNSNGQSVTVTLSCPFEGCDRSYSKQSNLQSHIDAFHEGHRPFKCTHDGCSSTFAFKHCLLRHLKLHMEGRRAAKKRPRRPLSSKLSGFVVKRVPDQDASVVPNEVCHNGEEEMLSDAVTM